MVGCPQHRTAAVTKKERKSTHTRAHPCASMPVTLLISDDMPTTVSCSDASLHWLSLIYTCTVRSDRKSNHSGLAWQQTGPAIASQNRKKLQLLWKGWQNSFQLCRHKVERLYCWLVMFYSSFSDRTHILFELIDNVCMCVCGEVGLKYFFCYSVWAELC